MKLPQQPPAPTGLAGLGVVLMPLIRAGQFSATVEGRYLHWDELRFRTPPRGLDHARWWSAICLARETLLKPLPLLDAQGRPFRFGMPDPLQQMLSETDRDLSGRVAIPAPLATPGTRDRYQASALIEEAITSSQLEGASTTRRVASEMLRSGRAPRDLGERMVVNMLATLRFLREVKAPLTPDAVLQIHARVTDDTLENPRDAGRLRTDNKTYVHHADGTLLHVPPPHGELKARLKALCDFANGKTPESFLHPIARAALLHFWLGHDHPFVDGNGRTARALFYWSMLNSGYWLAEYLSISHVLRRAPAEYSRAYLHSEGDRDATYFVIHQLSVVERALKALRAYVREKHDALEQTQSLLRHSAAFNHRQLALLGHALANPGFRYTVTSHATSHAITRQTARTDLLALSARGLLDTEQRGNAFVFLAPNDLDQRIRKPLRSGKRGPLPGTA